MLLLQRSQPREAIWLLKKYDAGLREPRLQAIQPVGSTGLPYSVSIMGNSSIGTIQFFKGFKWKITRNFRYVEFLILKKEEAIKSATLQILCFIS